MESDRVFNLQLTIQKLEEELHLYRNGTTGSEFLGIISEKDKEIDHLTQLLLEKNDKFKKLKATSQEVLSRCDQLERDNGSMKQQITSLTSEIDDSHRVASNLQASVSQLEYEKGELMASNSEQSDLIAQMEANDHENNEIIDKLQKRMATLLQEKYDWTKAVEMEKAAMNQELEHQRMRFREMSDLCERINEEKTALERKCGQLEKAVSAQKKESQELRGKIISDENRYAELQSVTSNLSSSVHALEKQLAEEMRKADLRESAFKSTEEQSKVDVAEAQRTIIEVSC